MAKKRHGVTYYTVSELAEKLNVHRNSVIYWINTDQLEAERWGIAKRSPFMIPESEYERVVEQLGKATQ